ncbi:hypothetical protein PG301_25790 [Parageobacillus sp. G301]|nr:hypothetical protein PG301_25790 [Parageobacillus sp. G301]
MSEIFLALFYLDFIEKLFYNIDCLWETSNTSMNRLRVVSTHLTSLNQLVEEETGYQG